MTELRLNTVFDYSDLRLHPDGTRVNQKPTNVIPRIAKAAVRTSRNRWIASDAGGHANIRKYQTTKGMSQDSQGDEEFLKFEADSPKPEDKGFKMQSKKHKIKRSDKRTAKRQKFLEDYDFLNNDVSTSSNLASDARTECFPYEPSSDLLKCIHHYASEYYTESGQLLDSSRDYRREKKMRRDKRKVEGRTKVSTSPTNSRTRSPNDGSLGSESDILPRDGDYGNESGSEADESKFKEMEKPQRKGRRTAKQYLDMYKVFDGSAILAIGMLVQEYIAEILDPQPPGEWEDEMRKAFAAEYTSEDEGDAEDSDIDDPTGHAGSDSDAEINSDEQDHDDGESSLRNDSEDPEDSNGNSSSTPPRSLVEDEVKIDPHDEWLGGPWSISDRSLG